MITKVCGINSQENLAHISSLAIDMIGFNFYPQSKRYLESKLALKKENFERVGVFVNANLSSLAKIQKDHALDYLQLHGDENLEYCKKAKSIAPIIKVFRIQEGFDFNITEAFQAVSKYFLFDTFTKSYGGSGEKFSWSTLNNYMFETPFILSGGISAEDADNISKLNHPKFAGVDLNSRFEITPGVKDREKLKHFLNGIN